MALSTHARRCLRSGFANAAAADDFADVVDAGSGTINNHTTEFLKVGLSNSGAAQALETVTNAGTGITPLQQRLLSNMVGDAGVAQEIATELA